MGRGEWSELPPTVREKFTQETLNFYNSFVQQEGSDPSLQHERAVAYRALGEVHKRSGKFPDAETFFGESISILEPLVHEYPKHFEYRQQLAWSHYALATILVRTRRPAEAQTSLERAITLYEQLVNERPDDDECFLEMLTCYADLVRAQHDQRAFEQLARTAEQAVERAKKIPAAAASAPDVLTYLATWLANAGRAREAVAIWRQAIQLNSTNVNGYNQVAWFLATCPDPKSRDPRTAVEMASKAVELAPTYANAWNTLGVAQYRAGDWNAAIEALNKSMELRHGGDSVDWFFLAMAHWQLGNREAARALHDKAVDWMQKKNPSDEQLIRFRNESAELLGLSNTPTQSAADANKPEPPPNAESAAEAQE
jgi:tetratricopeptide (TPR) repeat protein